MTAIKHFLLLIFLGVSCAWQPVMAEDAPKAAETDAPLNVIEGYGVGGVVLWLAADNGVTLDRHHRVILLADRTGNFNLVPSGFGVGPMMISDVPSGHHMHTGDSLTGSPLLVPDGLNGHPVFRLNRFQSLYSADSFGNALNRDMTFIIVAMTHGSDEYQEFSLYLGQNSTPHANRAMGTLNGKDMFDGQFATCLGLPVERNVFTMTGTSINTSLRQASFYRNGKLVIKDGLINKAKGEGFKPLSDGITMGAATGTLCGWNGDIAEELVFDHQLSPAEMQTIWSGLSAKYGLAGGAATALAPEPTPPSAPKPTPAPTPVAPRAPARAPAPTPAPATDNPDPTLD